MALTLNAAAPRGVSKPYVNAPGANPASAAAFTKAAQSFYSPVYGGTTTDTSGSTTPATSSGGGSTTTTNAPFDYQTYLSNDPMLKQALAGLNANGVQNQAQLQAGQNRALVQRGLVPPASALPGVGTIDATTRQLADQNTQAGTSTQAAITRAYKEAQQGSDNSLAARGLLHSGAYGQHAAENLQGFNQAGYQADQQLSDYLSGLYSGYLQQQQTLQGQGLQAQNDALTRTIALINAGLLGGGSGGGGGGGGNDQPPAANTPLPQLSPGSTATGSYNGVLSPANPTQYATPSLTLPPVAAPRPRGTRSVAV